MPKSELIKSSGWFFIAGAFAFITLLIPADPISIPGSVVSAILMAVGLSRLRAAYSEIVGRFGRSFLLLGMLGPVLWCVVIGSMPIIGVTETQVSEGLWVLIFVGPAISLLGLTLFGLAALRSKPMPRLNWLPFFEGIGDSLMPQDGKRTSMENSGKGIGRWQIKLNKRMSSNAAPGCSSWFVA